MSPVNYATVGLDAASGAMAAYLAYLAGRSPSPPLPSPSSRSLSLSPFCRRVPRGQADEPVARSHPVSCRFRPYAVRVSWCARCTYVRSRRCRVFPCFRASSRGKTVESGCCVLRCGKKQADGGGGCCCRRCCSSVRQVRSAAIATATCVRRSVRVLSSAPLRVVSSRRCVPRFPGREFLTDRVRARSCAIGNRK